MFLGFVCACVAIKGSDNKHLLSPSGSFLFLGITADVHVVKFINHVWEPSKKERENERKKEEKYVLYQPAGKQHAPLLQRWAWCFLQLEYVRDSTLETRTYAMCNGKSPGPSTGWTQNVIALVLSPLSQHTPDLVTFLLLLLSYLDCRIYTHTPLAAPWFWIHISSPWPHVHSTTLLYNTLCGTSAPMHRALLKWREHSGKFQVKRMEG